MIINIDAFKKSENVINQAQDRLSGDSAMKYIADTTPIVIIDDPQGADVYVLSGERDLYEGYSVAGIDCTPGNEGIEFTNGEFLRLGKAMGDIDENVIKRAQIRRTTQKHLEKELDLPERFEAARE